MDELSKRRKWRRWLALLETEVQRLQEEHQLYTALREHLSGEPEWVSWIDTLYLVGVSLSIRRLTDANPRHRTVSLVKLLQEMEAHAECLSRRSVLQRADASQRAQIHRLFDNIAGEEAMYVPPSVVRQWREDFEHLAAPFRTWVDRRVAHYDLSVHCAPPEGQQLEQVLRWLQDTLKVLNLLIKKTPRGGEEV
ncbi:MAG: hypothetical protein KatS3mg022_1122 [Armatimonadota bacterium]|nr:MAG: hypothetical protein KatS3mg022_1122 [Armatimonadota bacterium]